MKAWASLVLSFRRVVFTGFMTFRGYLWCQLHTASLYRRVEAGAQNPKAMERDAEDAQLVRTGTVQQAGAQDALLHRRSRQER